MSDVIWLAIGLVLVIEGLTYALVPGQMQKLAEQLQHMPAERLRVIGTAVMGLGVIVIWLSSGTLPE